MKLILILLALFAVYRCTSSEDSDGYLKESHYEKVDVNVYFSFPDDDNRSENNDYYLGETRGASSCGSIAWSYAYEKKVQNKNWSYICQTTDGAHNIR